MKVAMVSQVYTFVCQGHQVVCFAHAALIYVTYTPTKLLQLSEDIMNILQIHFQNYET